MTILDINVDGKDIDTKTFLIHCEQLCFDCGKEFQPSERQFKIDDGVILCTPCFETAKEDYPSCQAEHRHL